MIVHVRFPVGATALLNPFTTAVIVVEPPSCGEAGFAVSEIVGIAGDTTVDVEEATAPDGLYEESPP